MSAFDKGKEIVEILRLKGYTAYFAGGWVRDYLLGHPSADIDIATDAPTDVILELYPHTIQVGIQFGSMIVPVNGDHFEVSVFRRDINYEDGRRPTKIEPSSPEEDAQRRDFTINGMFFDPLTNTLYDYVNGQEDLKSGVIRAIGDPKERFKEDRLRMIRAIRFSERFHFPIESRTEEAIREYAPSLLPSVSMERIWQEFSRMAEYPPLQNLMNKMAELGLLQAIFPEMKSLPLQEIKARLSHYADLPQEIHPIVYITELFPEKSLQDMVKLCRYLKISNQDIKFVEFLMSCKELVKTDCQDLQEWSHVYGNPFGNESLQIIAAKLPSVERAIFVEAHQTKREMLARHIHRIESRTPLVTAQHLQDAGIAPGKKMGILLKEAERIAIQENLHTPEEVIGILTQTPLWLREYL